jgi:hypothetical protein
MISFKKNLYWVVGCLCLLAILIAWWFVPFFKKSSEWISAFAAVGSSVGVVFVWLQLITAKDIAQLQFEDGLAKEYRELANRIPTKALLGSQLSPKEYQAAFDELFRYIDLSNEQVILRKHRRITPESWKNWCDGIKTNLDLPAFKRAWLEIQAKSNNFQELRVLEQEEQFEIDPASWAKK